MSAPLDEANFPHYKRVSDYLLGTCIGEGSFAKVRVGLHCPTKEKVRPNQEGNQGDKGAVVPSLAK